MKNIILIILILFTFISCNYGIVNVKELRSGLEQAYFEGQKDYKEGDIRIKLNQDSCYIWSKSPWNDNSSPIYNPTYNCKF